MTLDKEFLLKKSRTFCMAPWIHLHSSPVGYIGPCCISRGVSGSTNKNGENRNAENSSLMELVNLPIMNNLRHQMLNEIPNQICGNCYEHEMGGIRSFRNSVNEDFGDYFDESVNETNEDGSLKTFKMRYFDIRFNNICNFKCRTCGSEFSSQWEQEDKKYLVRPHGNPKHVYTQLLQDVLDQIPNIDTAYFAGGEPLITEEHYLILEEMIKHGRTDIQLRYNTNLSNLKFKNKDIFDLWKHFKSKISIYASIDHVGERAEYIRHGTDWGLIESNFIRVKKESYIKLQMNTVLSIFNYVTIKDFYEYLYDKNLYTAQDSTFSLYGMTTPVHLTVNTLPLGLRLVGRKNFTDLINFSRTYHNYHQDKMDQFDDLLKWETSLPDKWDDHKRYFRSEITRLDAIRGENFVKVFPELARLMDD